MKRLPTVRPRAPARAISTIMPRDRFPTPLPLSRRKNSIHEPTATLTARHHSSCGTGMVCMRILLVSMPKVQQDMARKEATKPLRSSRFCSGSPLWGERRIRPATISTAAKRTMGLAGSPRKIQEAGTTIRG